MFCVFRGMFRDKGATPVGSVDLYVSASNYVTSQRSANRGATSDVNPRVCPIGSKSINTPDAYVIRLFKWRAKREPVNFTR